MSATQKPALVIMAAGMGSRFGGPKQITPVGPAGELLMDYSIYDALRAGFGRVVFVIKREMEQDFREAVGDRIAAQAPVTYVYQDVTALPNGYAVPEGRVKPWGTGHAVLCCRQAVTEPFAVINADDYYGSECYRLLAETLSTPSADGVLNVAMAGYVLKNTLTENGYVSRGVCETDPAGYLTGITERTRIELHEEGPCFTEDGGESWTPLAPDTTVSMNCWGFPAGTLEHFEALFRAFLDEKGGELKSEFYLPAAVNELVAAGKARVAVRQTPDKWYGMTYAEDREAVKQALQSLTEQGFYPAPLWQ